jgi:hypothetical protein
MVILYNLNQNVCLLIVCLNVGFWNCYELEDDWYIYRLKYVALLEIQTQLPNIAVSRPNERNEYTPNIHIYYIDSINNK